MTITVQYVGDRPYVEFTEGGKTYGFARQTIRDDIPLHLAERFESPGFPQWKVEGLAQNADESKAKEMVAAIEAPVEPTPEPVVEEESPVVEESPVAFDESWTKAKMVAWCAENGITINERGNKASIIEAVNQASAPSEGDE